MITRTVVCLILAAPDRNRRVYGVYRATGTSPDAPCLQLQQEIATLVLVNNEEINYRALAELHATADAPVWEKL